MRMPHAAKTLIAQVSAAKPQTKAKPVGEMDGLGVYRTVQFNKATGSWLRPLLEELGDRRIAGLEVTSGGLLEVTFVDGIKADDRTSFLLEAAQTVTSG